MKILSPLKISAALIAAIVVSRPAAAETPPPKPANATTVDSVHTSPLPLALHPDNPHYFLFRGKPTLLISSGEHYGAVLNLDFDDIKYLDELQACGLNHTRLFTGTYHEVLGAFGIADNTLAPKAARFIGPWQRTNTPGEADGENKFDLTRFNPAYFDRLTKFLSEASQRGIVVEVNLFCPNYDDSLWNISPMNDKNNVNGIGKCGRDEVYTLKHPDLLAVQQAVARKIVEAAAPFDNLYFEVCNEPYFGGVTMDWQDKIVETILDAEKDRPAKHLISMNIANGRKKVEKPNPAVSIFNFHYCTPPDTVEMNEALNKVIGENETGFKGSQDVTYRTEGWDFITAGGGLYDSLDYSFTTSHSDGSAVGYKAPGGGSHALRVQLGAMRKFMESFDFIHMKPDNAIIKGGVQKGTTARALAQPGKQYAVYIKGGTHIDLQIDLPAGTYAVRWLNPTSGEVSKSETVKSSGGLITIESPDYTQDVALGIVSKPEN
ncbi:MAG TPA: putative collagen-binding domain-containing protein [Tepidisphaeraceae bacterium]|jgi:hypothetical protein|nr:putative collagen-binding domain-containing protein [Tepidisphaeraceae bacterium]